MNKRNMRKNIMTIIMTFALVLSLSGALAINTFAKTKTKTKTTIAPIGTSVTVSVKKPLKKYRKLVKKYNKKNMSYKVRVSSPKVKIKKEISKNKKSITISSKKETIVKITPKYKYKKKNKKTGEEKEKTKKFPVTKIKFKELSEFGEFDIPTKTLENGESFLLTWKCPYNIKNLDTSKLKWQYFCKDDQITLDQVTYDSARITAGSTIGYGSIVLFYYNKPIARCDVNVEYKY